MTEKSNLKEKYDSMEIDNKNLIKQMKKNLN